MKIYDCLATIQFLEYRSECGVARVFAIIGREEADAICLDGVERIFDLSEAAVDIRKRHDREEPISPRIITDLLSGILVPHPRQSAASGDVAEPDARGGDRNDRGGNAVLIHDIERLGHAPRAHLARRNAVTEINPLLLLLHICGRQEMMMDVDPFLTRGLSLRCLGEPMAGAPRHVRNRRRCMTQDDEGTPSVTKVSSFAKPTMAHPPAT